MSARPPGIARFDSAAAMVQAIASFLHGRDVASLSASPWLDLAMPAVNYLPRRAREWAYSIGGMAEAVGRAKIPDVIDPLATVRTFAISRAG